MNGDLNGLDLDGDESEENLDTSSDLGIDDETDREDLNGASTHVGG
ncbi:hypothetical protein [Deinococcus sp. UYEF24]